MDISNRIELNWIETERDRIQEPQYPESRKDPENYGCYNEHYRYTLEQYLVYYSAEDGQRRWDDAQDNIELK